MGQMWRSRLAGLLREEPFCEWELPVERRDLMAVASTEGVTALVAQRIHALHDEELRAAFATRARGMAAASMLRDAEGKRVSAILEEAGIACLLLKGSALGWWLYPLPYLRETADFDLLFKSAAHAKRAARLLEAHGYSRGEYFGSMAHEVTVRRSTSTMTMDLDLHWRLFNSPLFADVLPNSDLFAESMAISAFHEGARGLSVVHATVHACLHRAMNLHMGVGDRLKWLFDLHLLSDRLSADDWTRIIAIGREHKVATFFLDALVATQEAFSTRIPGPVLVELTSHSQAEGIDCTRLGEWRYMQRLGVARIPTVAGRLRWLKGMLFPPLDYLRSFYGARLTWWELWIERIRRLVWRVR